MEKIENLAETNHPDFDRRFLDMLTERTRKNPRLRVARLAANFENLENKEKIRELFLCDRECYEAASIKHGSELYLSNKDIIAECLLSDDANLRENAVKLICHMLNDGDAKIKDMAKEKFMSDLPLLLKGMVIRGSLKDEVSGIINNIFSKENIDTALENYGFARNLLGLLEDVIKNRSFEDEVKYIIKNTSSYKNLGSVLERIDTSLGRLVPRDIVKGLAKEQQCLDFLTHL